MHTTMGSKWLLREGIAHLVLVSVARLSVAVSTNGIGLLIGWPFAE